MRIIVSFTSYPQRIESVHMVVESLHRQIVTPDEIILYLSLEEFPRAEDDLPDNLKVLIGKKGLRIEWVEGNLKSHKKYYHSLQKYREDIVITVDDDMIYSESMISDLVKGYDRFPHAISARRTRMILRRENGLESYRRWDGNLEEYAKVPRMDLCAIGVGGVCYPPGAGSESWFEKEDMMSVAGNQDDLWLKYNEILDHIPVLYVLPTQKDSPIRIGNVEKNSLFCSNINGGNDSCASTLLERLRTAQPSQYQKWFYSLMNWNEYAAQKRAYYSNIIKTDFDKAKDMPIYLYGAGKIAESLLDQLSELQLTNHITAVAVSSKEENPSELKGIAVKQLNQIDRGKRFGIIFGVNESNRHQIETTVLKGYDYCTIDLNTQALTKYFDIISGWK